jgi:hypothetical protein
MRTWRGIGVALALAAVACSGGVEIVTDSGADVGADAPTDAKPDSNNKDAQADVQNDAQGDAASDAQADVAIDVDGGTDASLDAKSDGGPADVVVVDAIKPDVVVIDAGQPDAKPPPDGGVCNALSNGASPVTMQQSNAQVPAAVGGSVNTGLYYLTAVTWFNGQTGPVGSSVALTLDVANGTLQSVATQNAQTDRGSFAWKTSQTAWAMAETCPGNAQSSANYSATQTLLKLYFDVGQGNMIEEVFTHQ